MSQILSLGVSFYFRKKKGNFGNFLYFFSNFHLLQTIKQKLSPISNFETLRTDLGKTHTSFQADKYYNKLDIHVEKISVKNDEFKILHTFAQTSLNLLNDQLYEYKGLINGYRMIHNIFYSCGK